MNASSQPIHFLNAARPSRLMQRGALAGVLLLATQGIAQNFAIDRFAISSGGGVSSNAQFSVTGTIGQMEASPRMSGGGYSVEGGLWHLAIVVAPPGEPRLDLVAMQTGGALLFTWPLSAAGYELESSPAVGPAAVWTSVATPAQRGAQYHFLLLRPQPGISFFRLKKVVGPR